MNHRKNFKLFYQILKLVDQKTTADGTVDLPARTCRELFNAKRNAAKKSGKYVIDPNEGSPEDAVLAYCNRDTMETCIPVKSTSQLEKQKIGESDKHEYTWAFEESNGNEIEYIAPIGQMKLLQLLSTNARQNFTYHCMNSNAVADKDDQLIAHPLIVKLDNEREETLSLETESRMKVVHDSCKSKHGWGKTEVSIKTQDASELPILDIAAYEVGHASSSQVGIEIGQVCFS